MSYLHLTHSSRALLMIITACLPFLGLVIGLVLGGIATALRDED